MNQSQNILKKFSPLVLLLFCTVLGASPLLSNACTDIVDLSLAITVDNPHPKIGDRVTFTISIENKSDFDATGISVKSLIPSGQGNTSCTSFDGRQEENYMVWENLFVDRGTKLSFVYHAEILERGDYNTLTEIVAMHQEDVDSTPNNGADNDNDGLVGSYDLDDSFDLDDEDDGDDVSISITSNTADFVSAAQTKITVYPNPSTGQVNLDVFNPQQKEVKVMMYSQVGVMIDRKSEIQQNGTIEYNEVIEVSDLKPGKYLFNVMLGETSYIKTVIIAR